jgi:intein/homing endonuclease
MNNASFTAASTIPAKLFCGVDLFSGIINKKIKPIHIQINPTNRCPLNCTFCSVKNRDRSIEIPRENLIKITDNFISLGTKAVTMSVAGDEIVVINKNGFVSIKTIKNIVENKNDYLNTKSWSYDKKIVNGKIKKFFKHWASKVYRIVLDSGRNIRVTGDHSLYFYENGKIINKTVSSAKIKDKIVMCNISSKKIMRSIDVSKFCVLTRRGLKNPGSFLITPDFCRFLGYFTAEGSYGSGNWCLNFTFGKYAGKEKKYINDLVQICHTMGFKKNTVVDKSFLYKTSVRLYSKWFVEMVRFLNTGDRANIKKIPDIIFNTTKINQIEFLKGLFAGDGNFRDSIDGHKRKNINKFRRNVLSLKTSSSYLIKTLGFLLDNLNIFYTINSGINKKRKINNRILNPSRYYTISISRKKDLSELREIITFMEKNISYNTSKYSCYDPKIKTTFIDKNVFALNIKKIDVEEYNDYVYDIEVEQTHKFITSYGILAHNTGGGDPLAYPYLADYSNYLYEKNIKSGLVTNGVLLKQTDIDWIKKVTWCRVSLSDEYKLLTPKLKDIIEKCPVDWSFSYVVTPTTDINNVIKAIQFANENKFTHVRLVDDILDETSPSKVQEFKSQMPNLIDDSIVIYQGRKTYTHGHKRCLISLLKPNIGPDGLIQACCGIQYRKNPPALDLLPEDSMGGPEDIEDIWLNQKYFDGSTCEKCYYSDYNNILNIMWDSSNLKHQEFI